MWAIYHIEHPFFERYKINSEPWPWTKNQAEWNILIRRTLKLVAVNVFLMVPLFTIVDFYGNESKMKFSIDI